MTYTEWFQANLGYGTGWVLATLTLILMIALPVMLAVAMLIYADRKIWAAIALRRGPNVVGPLGLLQSFADGLKVFLQETIIPSSANRGLFLIAPIITFSVALIVWAVIPFSASMVLANINVGLLYVLAASSLGVYGVIISGWASNSKYPFYSALRAAAQMVSYEVSIGFVLISVVLFAGSFNLSEIVEGQRGHVFGILNGYGFNPLLFPMAVVFLISALAETARAPFDLTEAESELVAGFQTEYSSMAFAMFWLGEYANVILMCALNAILFWGGYLPPIDWAPLYAVPGILWLFAKILVFFFIFSWIKATVPRFRYDQLMRLGWKIFLPLSLFWVFLVSGYLMLTRYGPQADAEIAAYGARIGQPVAALRNCLGVYADEPVKTIFRLKREWRAGHSGPPIWSIEWPGVHIGQVQELPVGSEKSEPTTRLAWNNLDGSKVEGRFYWVDEEKPGNDAAILIGLPKEYAPWAICREPGDENTIYN